MSSLVSILIPVYNCERWVASAIESALAQTWPNKEIIVLDDASTDGTVEALEPFRSSIRIESVATNGGQNASRNRLTAMSRGEWLVYLDADDELASDSTEKKMMCAKDADAVYGSKKVSTFRDAESCDAIEIPAKEYDDPFIAAFQWKYPNTSSFLFRRSSLLEAGGWNEQVQNCTDYALYFPMLLRGCKFRAAPDAWSVYRQWTTAQAVYVAPLRKMLTRLSIMQDAAVELKNTGQLTPAREQAFLNASLQVIRTIFPVDHRQAWQEHKKLRDWNRAFRPSAACFPENYRRVYSLFGFRTAEVVAAMARLLNPPKLPPLPFNS